MNIDARTQDGFDIYGFPKRKWSLNVTYFYFAINIAYFSLMQISSFAVNAWTTLVVHTTLEVNLQQVPVLAKVIIEKSFGGIFLWNRNWKLGWIWADWQYRLWATFERGFFMISGAKIKELKWGGYQFFLIFYNIVTIA